MSNLDYKIGCIACIAFVSMVVAFVLYLAMLIYSIIKDTTI